MVSRRVARRHFLTAGIEYRNNFRQDQDAQTLEPEFDHYLSAHVSSQVFAAYAQDEIALSSRLTATVRSAARSQRRTRIDERPAGGDLQAGRALGGEAALWQRVQGAESVRAVLLRQSHHPDARAHPDDGSGLGAVSSAAALRTSVSAFFYRAHDLISQVPGGSAGVFTFANLDKARARGIELEAEATWREMHVLASYTHQDVDGGADHQRLSNSPRNMLRSRVTGPLFHHTLFYGVEGLYTGDRLALRGGVAEGALLGNMTLTTRELSRARVSVTIGNLFNRQLRRSGQPKSIPATSSGKWDARCGRSSRGASEPAVRQQIRHAAHTIAVARGRSEPSRAASA